MLSLQATRVRILLSIARYGITRANESTMSCDEVCNTARARLTNFGIKEGRPLYCDDSVQREIFSYRRPEEVFSVPGSAGSLEVVDGSEHHVRVVHANY